MNKAVSEELQRLAFVLFFALLIGLNLNAVAWSLVVGFCIYLYLHFRKGVSVLDWLEKKNILNGLPNANGIWGEVIYKTIRIGRKNRKAKKKLSSLLNRFYKTGAALPDATVVLGKDGAIEWFNKSAGELLNLRQPQDYGSKITNLLRDPKFHQYFDKADFTKPLEIALEARSLHISIRITPHGNNNLLMSAQDVTRMYQLEQIRQDFVANISHELRTPLTVLRGYLEILADEENVEQEEIHVTLGQMKQQADRMQSLVEDLLMLSGLQRSLPDKSHNSKVAVPILIENVRDDAIILSGENKHEIELDLDQNLWLLGNAKELQSAVSNLVSNAIRYSPDGGKILISWSRSEQYQKYVVLEVRDYGIGIEPHHIPRLTERFYRVDKGRSQTTGGTGLGLAIVKHVLQRHDGYLQIDSVSGRGSTFRCFFSKERIIPAESIDIDDKLCADLQILQGKESGL